MGRLTELFDYLNSEDANISDARYSHLTINDDLRTLKKDYKKRNKKSKSESVDKSEHDS